MLKERRLHVIMIARSLPAVTSGAFRPGAFDHNASSSFTHWMHLQMLRPYQRMT